VFDPYNEESKYKEDEEERNVNKKFMESIKKAHTKTIKMITREFLFPLGKLEKIRNSVLLVKT
jgi:hypothetical protein